MYATGTKRTSGHGLIVVHFRRDVFGRLQKPESRLLLACTASNQRKNSLNDVGFDAHAVRLGLFHFGSWHFELLPAPLLLLGWNVLGVCGNPPDVAAWVFDAAIPLTGRQCHDRKNGNPAGAERTLIDCVAIGDV